MNLHENEDAVLEIAQIAHEVNRAYCQSIGDNSQPEWNDADPGIQEGIKRGVCLHLENPGMTPEQSHDAWLRDRAAQGWVYGPEKDVAAKTHPAFLAYGKLPREQQSKDYIFSAVVRALAAIYGE